MVGKSGYLGERVARPMPRSFRRPAPMWGETVMKEVIVASMRPPTISVRTAEALL